MNRLIGLIKIALVAISAITIVGCARPIVMAPDLAGIQGKGVTKIDKNAGYFISEANRALEINSPGGGGDKLRYFAYRDIEPGFYKALGEAFKNVTKLNGPKDQAAITKDSISIVITPTITTTSSSPSAFTWPPTKFSVTLACAITDANGIPMREITVTGSGAAEFDEFKSNFSLSAVRATNDALDKLVQALGNAPELRK
jgi:hypothetical protein